MFTRQAGQIENALRGAGVPDISAKEMMQGLANCQAPLEHRAGVALTRNPRDNRYMFPGMPPTQGTPDFYVSPSIAVSSFSPTIVNIPPWQHVPWTPIPYPEQEEWQPIPYPEWPSGQYPWDDVGIIVNSPTYLGPVTTETVNTENINSTTINNEGDTHNNNAIFNAGPAFFNGPVHHHHRVINNRTVINKETVIHEGPVRHGGPVYNEITYNNQTHNYGETSHYDTTYMTRVYSSGPNEFAGDTYLEGGDVFINGDIYVNGEGPLSAASTQVLTDVEWTGSELRKTYRTLQCIGDLGAAQTATIVSGTSCPTTPLSASPSNFADIP